MIVGSCHFLCHQFTQRDEPDQIIADMDALAAFPAAFVRSPDIDRLYQFMSRIGRQFRQFCVLSDLLNQFLFLSFWLFSFFYFSGQKEPGHIETHRQTNPKNPP